MTKYFIKGYQKGLLQKDLLYVTSTSMLIAVRWLVEDGMDKIVIEVEENG